MKEEMIAPVQTEDSDAELNPEEMEDVQGGISGGGQYLSDEAKARKRQAAGATTQFPGNNS